MKPLFLIILTLILFFTLPLICRPDSVSSSQQMIIYYWLILSVLIGIYEFYLIFYGLIYSPQSFWQKNYQIGELFNKDFWLDGWGEYAKSDIRYFDRHSLANQIELTNLLLTFLPSLYALIYFQNVRPIVFYIGVVQLLNTCIYFLTLFKGRYFLHSQYR